MFNAQGLPFRSYTPHFPAMVQHLIAGLRRFRREYFPQYRAHYEELAAHGQKPSTLFIGCCDSRVEPSLFTDSMPGQLFVVRNIGNFVPPYESADGYHGVTAAIEFATVILKVTDIVICGHSDCGAIRALYQADNPSTPHITKWLELAEAAKLDGEVTPELLRSTEERSIVLQMERLLSFPSVEEQVASGKLSVHGWHYDIGQGLVRFLDVDSGEFKPI